jgi:hypothetical protein
LLIRELMLLIPAFVLCSQPQFRLKCPHRFLFELSRVFATLQIRIPLFF